MQVGRGRGCRPAALGPEGAFVVPHGPLIVGWLDEVTVSLMVESPSTIPPRDAKAGRKAAEAERWELLGYIQAALEPAMVVLGLVFLLILLIDYSGADLTEAQRIWFDRASWAIYATFVIDFALRFVVAPSKPRYLRANWLTALSLVLPALRPLRALRALRALRGARAARSLSLVRLVGGTNRGIRVLRRVTRGQTFAYLVALSILVVLASATGVRYFDRGAEDAHVRSFGDALWWAATLVTTMGVGLETVSPEARVIGFLLRLYALSVFGYVTAAIATYFIGRDAEDREAAATGAAELSAEVIGLRREVSALRQELAQLRRELRSADGRAARHAGRASQRRR